MYVYTVQPVFKDNPWKENNLVSVHRWSLITGSFVQEMSDLDINGAELQIIYSIVNVLKLFKSCLEILES